nr:putative late blight resistance protein homolog R1B-8 [Ipomoea batatas]
MEARSLAVPCAIFAQVKTSFRKDTMTLRHLGRKVNDNIESAILLKVCIELRENKILGFEEDLKTIKIELMGASQDFSVIQIVGNAGTGKTTFASQIFEDSEIRNYFTHFVWVNVSRGFHRKQKFIDILHQISGQTGDFDTDNKLEDKVKELLEDQRYFIILDDVQKKEDWESFEVLFPKNLKGSRVLVTTLSGNVVDSTWKSHSLGKLSNDNGWLVIKNNVFGTTEESVDTLFKELGIKIAEKCNTLPHALVLVAGILRHCLTAAGWQRVADLEINGEGQIYQNNPPDSFFNLFNKRMGALRQDGDSVGSLLLSSSQKSEIHSTPEQLETILKTFQYLDVLNIESLKFSSLPNELYSQCYISYLAITADITSLPKSFENLSWLETLVIKTTKMTLQINGGIWNMEKLRHVHTNTSTQLPSPPKTGKHDRNQTDIRTLSTISPGSCTNEIFNMTPKLQKLGVRGKLSELLLLEKKQNVCLFNNLQMLECLENLKLHGKSEEVKLKVPMLDKFPRRLKKLTLSGTLFQWNDMTVLGLLEKLKVLKLDDNAFSGEHWDLSSDVNFKRLQYLRIRMTNLKTWKSEVKKSFPVLESLVLRNCISLEKIPQDFANVDSLELMEVFDVSEKVADFAREICVKRHGKINVKINGFITHLPSQETVHNVEYEKENVNTSEFDYPSTSILSQEIEHNQAYGDENVNTNGFEHPSTSTLSEEIVSADD